MCVETCNNDDDDDDDDDYDKENGIVTFLQQSNLHKILLR